MDWMLPCREVPAAPKNSIREMGDSDSCDGISTDMRRPGDPDLSIPPPSKSVDVTMSHDVRDLGDIEAKAMVESAEDGPGKMGSSICLGSSDPASSSLKNKLYSWKRRKDRKTTSYLTRNRTVTPVFQHWSP